MPKTHLILAEGLPRSGKTSTARFAAAWLAQHGYAPRLYLEGDLDQPADYESVARLDADAYADLLGEFPAHRQTLEGAGWQRVDEHFFSYRKPLPLPQAVLQRLAQYEIYELPPDRTGASCSRTGRNSALRRLSKPVFTSSSAASCKTRLQCCWANTTCNKWRHF